MRCTVCDNNQAYEDSVFCVKCMTGFALVGMKAVQYISILGEKDIIACCNKEPGKADAYREIHDEIVVWNRERLRYQKETLVKI